MILHLIALLIPVVAIAFGVGIAMLAIFLNYRKRSQMFALYHQERMQAIDKGIDLPPLPEAFFSEDGKPPRPYAPHRQLLIGLIWLFTGLALFAALYATLEFAVALFAMIPTGIGLAYLIYYFTVGKQEAERLQAAQAARLAETDRAQKP